MQQKLNSAIPARPPFSTWFCLNWFVKIHVYFENIQIEMICGSGGDVVAAESEREINILIFNDITWYTLSSMWYQIVANSNIDTVWSNEWMIDWIIWDNHLVNMMSIREHTKPQNRTNIRESVLMVRKTNTLYSIDLEI